MQIHGFTENGSIDATIDGERGTVPNDPSNRHRQMIAEWEAKGNTIPPYVPPSVEQSDDPQALLQAAMLEEFTERMATNKTAPKHLKEAALRVKALKNDG